MGYLQKFVCIFLRAIHDRSIMIHNQYEVHQVLSDIQINIYNIKIKDI